MTAEEWIALIGIILGFIATNVGHIVTGRNNSNKMLQALKEQSDRNDATIDKAVAVYSARTDTRLDELTREVREHNNFARRVPVIEEQIKVANHRIEDLERMAK